MGQYWTIPPTHPLTLGRSCEAQSQLIVWDDRIGAAKPGYVVRLARSVEDDRSFREPLIFSDWLRGYGPTQAKGWRGGQGRATGELFRSSMPRFSVVLEILCLKHSTSSLSSEGRLIATPATALAASSREPNHDIIQHMRRTKPPSKAEGQTSGLSSK